MTGIFVPGYDKIANVGINCCCWITQHGVAINVEQHRLPPFAGIVPCGLTGLHGQVASVNDLMECPITVAAMAHYVQ